MGGAFSTYEGKGEEHTGFWWRNLKEINHLEDPRRRWRIILTFRNLASYIWDGSKIAL